jgi:hypothetical protein
MAAHVRLGLTLASGGYYAPHPQKPRPDWQVPWHIPLASHHRAPLAPQLSLAPLVLSQLRERTGQPLELLGGEAYTQGGR